MTKAELIEMVHETSDVPKVVVERVLDGLRGVMESVFDDGGGISLPGVGKFSVKNQAERKGRNPKTGAEITIPAGRRVAFSASKSLKDIVNAG